MLFDSTSSRKKILSRYRLKEFPYLVVSNFLGFCPSNPIIQQRKKLINQFLIAAKMKGKLKPNKTKPNQSRTTFAIISTTRFLFLFLHSLFCLYLFTLFASLATIDFSSHGIVSLATYRKILFKLQTLFVKYPTKNKEIETFLKFWNKKTTYDFGGWPFVAKIATSSTATTKSTSTATATVAASLETSTAPTLETSTAPTLIEI